MKCLNVIVYYNNGSEVEQYINEVWSIDHEMVDICVVINSDKEKQASSRLEQLSSSKGRELLIFDFKENVGYLNSLLRSILETDISKYDYVILSNTDIHYEDEAFFVKLSEASYPENVGCIAPSVYAAQSNSYSNPHYLNRVPLKKLRRLIFLFSRPGIGKLYLKLAGLKAGTQKKEKQASCYVYSPHGCYMIFTGAFIQLIRGYIYGVQLYSEESCIGELLIRYGKKCYYDDSIEVVHDESSVTGKIDYRRRFKAWKESLEYIVKEFY